MHLSICPLGTMPYAPALELQRSVAQARISGELDHDVLLLVEHPPVVTLGRTSKPAHLGVSAEHLATLGIELFEVERGGDVTFHGPGQLVGYPIFDLKGLKPDLHWYLRQVEEALIRTVASYGVAGTRNPGYTGVWVPGEGVHPVDAPRGAIADSGRSGPEPGPARARKIASIGVHAREWVTWHGFALNVNTDLSYFDLIVPCGIPDVTMTSLARETGKTHSLDDVRRTVTEEFVSAFGYRGSAEVAPSALGAQAVR